MRLSTVTLKPWPPSVDSAPAAVKPTTSGSCVVVGALAMTTLTPEPYGWIVPPPGVWVTTVPGAAVVVVCVVTVTVKPAPVSCVRAALSVSPLTLGTLTGAFPEEM